VLAAVRRRGIVPVLVGGTGLYLRALLVGLFAGPPRSEELRNRLRELPLRRGREFGHGLLARKDLESAQTAQKTASARVQSAEAALSLVKQGARSQDIEAARAAGPVRRDYRFEEPLSDLITGALQHSSARRIRLDTAALTVDLRR